jgi:hypothetical protein
MEKIMEKLSNIIKEEAEKQNKVTLQENNKLKNDISELFWALTVLADNLNLQDKFQQAKKDLEYCEYCDAMNGYFNSSEATKQSRQIFAAYTILIKAIS